MDVHEELRQANMRANKYREALEAVPVVLGQLDNDGKDFLTVVMQACLEAGMENGYEDRERYEQKNKKNKKDTYRIGHLKEKAMYWGKCPDESMPTNCYDGWTSDLSMVYEYGEYQRSVTKLPQNGCWVVVNKDE